MKLLFCLFILFMKQIINSQYIYFDIFRYITDLFHLFLTRLYLFFIHI